MPDIFLMSVIILLFIKTAKQVKYVYINLKTACPIPHGILYHQAKFSSNVICLEVMERGEMSGFFHLHNM